MAAGLVSAIAGLFVGGRGLRLGGRAKGLLAAPGGTETLLARWQRVISTAAPGVDIVLVGEHPAYAGLEPKSTHLPTLGDVPAGIGPLGGLHALLLHARSRGERDVLALAVDLPFVSTALLTRLMLETPDAPALAPRTSGRWQPLFARYATEPCLATCAGLVPPALDRALADTPSDGAHVRRVGVRSLLQALGSRASVLSLSPAEERELSDWDTPEDIERTSSPDR